MLGSSSKFTRPDLGSKKMPNGPHWVQMDLRSIQKKNNKNVNEIQIKIRNNNDKSK